MSEFTISVARLNEYVSARLEQDPFLADIWVEGEIERPKIQRGHCYFNLIDETATVSCVIWGVDSTGLRSLLVHGTRVYVHGKVTVFPKNGKYQINVRQMREAGLGELYQKMLELKDRLQKEGLFAPERKRPIPSYPRSIAVVTSKDGAALQDIINITKRRNPLMHVEVYPALVQGVRAPASIAAAIAEANETSKADVLIIARGGGSAGDLSAFDTEDVVYAVARSEIPTISAVGHQTDFSLCDLVADLRVPTPSAAAEMAVPDLGQIVEQISRLRQELKSKMDARMAAACKELEAEKRALRSVAVTQRLDFARERLMFFKRTGVAHLKTLLEKKRGEVRAQKAKLEALNPLRILKSGYAVVLKDGRRVNEASELQSGDRVVLLFADGRREARIEEKTSE